MEALNKAANGFSIQITAADLAKVHESYLFALQQAGFNEPLRGVVTDRRIFAQLRSNSLSPDRAELVLTGNPIVTPSCRYTGLIPPLPFARGIYHLLDFQ